jgi:hypothetical protein
VLPLLLNRSSSVQESVVITVVVIVSLPVLRLALLALCCSLQSHLHTHNACISKTLKIRIYKIMGNPAVTSVYKCVTQVLSPGKDKQCPLSNYVNYVPYLFHCTLNFLLNFICQKCLSD